MNPPRFLYKYQPVDKYTIDNLKARKLYFRKPAELDDPFDCRHRVLTPRMSGEDYRKIHDEIRRRFPKGVPNAYNIDNEHLADLGNPMLDNVLKRHLDTIGVTCFSERYDILLMWSFYADGHRGFCLEFDTQYYPFTKPENYVARVSYGEELPIINVFDLILDAEKAVSTVFTTKAYCWEFQKEWRVFNDEGGATVSLDNAQCLTGIYLGCHMNDSDKKTINDILANTPVRYYEMVRNENQFALRAEKLDMT